TCPVGGCCGVDKPGLSTARDGSAKDYTRQSPRYASSSTQITPGVCRPTMQLCWPTTSTNWPTGSSPRTCVAAMPTWSTNMASWPADTGQAREIFRRELLRTGPRIDLGSPQQRLGLRRAACPPRQRRSQRLTTLGERCIHHCGETLPGHLGELLVAAELRSE